MSPGIVILACATTAIGLAALALVGRWRAPLGPDEGYLWYGTQRLLAGCVPLRDFRSYEPGRYLWCAPFVQLLGSGVLGVRVASHTFFAAALTAALLVLHGLGFSPLGLGSTALLVVSWAFPQHKLFEPGVALLSFAGLAWLATHPGPGAAFVAGAGVGVISLFGVNLALYAGAALAAELGLLLSTGTPAGALGQSVIAACAGGLAGCTPLLAAIVVAPGFGRALLERRVLGTLARGTSNLPLRVPLPWRLPPPQLEELRPWRRRATGWLFAALPAAPLLGVLATAVITGGRGAALVSPWAAVLAASSLGILAWHHAYSRADLSHLAQAIIPLLLLIAVTLELVLGRGTLIVVAVAASLAFVWPSLGLWRRDGVGSPQLRPVQGWGLRLPARDAALLDVLGSVAGRELETGKRLLALPTLAWVYPALGCVSPVYDLFCVYRATEEEQEQMIAQIRAADVRLVVLSLEPLDGRPERVFPATHPRVMRYLQEHFEPVDAGLLPTLLLLRAPASRSGPRPAGSGRESISP